jgi:hypothetical protein
MATHRARLARPTVPAEPLRARPVALAESLARVREVLARIALGVVAETQLERIQSRGGRHLVERAFQRQETGSNPGARMAVGVFVSRGTRRSRVCTFGQA